MSLCGFGPFCLNSPCRELVTAGLDLPFPNLRCPDALILGSRHWVLTLLCVVLTSTHSLGRQPWPWPKFHIVLRIQDHWQAPPIAEPGGQNQGQR